MWTAIIDHTMRFLSRLPGLARWESGLRDSYGRLGPPSHSEAPVMTEYSRRRFRNGVRTVPASIELSITFHDGSTVSLIGQGSSTLSSEVLHRAGVMCTHSLRPRDQTFSNRNGVAAGVAGTVASVELKSCPMDSIDQAELSLGPSGTSRSI